MALDFAAVAAFQPPIDALLDAGMCWESRFTPSTRNDGARFTATAP